MTTDSTRVWTLPSGIRLRSEGVIVDFACEDTPENWVRLTRCAAETLDLADVMARFAESIRHRWAL